jgi:tRNA pseudouridine38-40 synthase
MPTRCSKLPPASGGASTQAGRANRPGEPRPDQATVAHRYRALVSYDGTAYAGYQIQPDRPTIQAELEKALGQVTRQAVRVFASGRTDQGVHARGQVIHFDLAAPLDVERLRRGGNAVLPPDIRLERVARASAAFDARFSATGKTYRYLIWNAAELTPDVRLYRTHVHRPLDVPRMRAAARRLVGRHDFASFSANPQREVDGTVRSLYALTVQKRGPEVIITARGEGFLYKMVRSLAGFLIRVGQGDLPPESADRILAAKGRTAEVPTAAPQGLFLWSVAYGGRRTGSA